MSERAIWHRKGISLLLNGFFCRLLLNVVELGKIMIDK